VKVARMAITAMWRSKRWEFVGILMAGSLSSAIEILDAGVGQGTVSLDEGSSLRLGLNPEWETISKLRLHRIRVFGFPRILLLRLGR
jgi:hypothetical protein